MHVRQTLCRYVAKGKLLCRKKFVTATKAGVFSPGDYAEMGRRGRGGGITDILGLVTESHLYEGHMKRDCATAISCYFSNLSIQQKHLENRMT